MYCIQCGVQLSDTEKKCPLCGTIVFHPELKQPDAAPLYPEDRYPAQRGRPFVLLGMVTFFFLLPMVICMLCDIQLNQQVNWAGYVTGALLCAYCMFVLPYWFHKPNPVIFVPCSFAAVGLYLLYICWATQGNWFMTFAFPTLGFVALIVTAVVTLLRYVKKGALYIYAGAFIATGLYMPVMEYLLNYTFSLPLPLRWSAYPVTVLVIFGGALIFLAICRPARAVMERKIFF